MACRDCWDLGKKIEFYYRKNCQIVEIGKIKLKIDSDLQELLYRVEVQWRKNLKQVYPLYWKIPLEWMLERKIESLWSIDTKSNKIAFKLLTNKGKVEKELRKRLKFIKRQEIGLFEEFFQYLLYHHFFHIIEAPFSDTGEFSDNKLIHKAIWDGIITAEPELSTIEVLEKVLTCHSIVKDFIIDNRLYLENLEFNWFTNDILLESYYNFLLHYRSRDMNFSLIISYINTVLYGSKALIPFLENNFLIEVAEIADKVFMKLLSSHKPILISEIKEEDNRFFFQLRKKSRLQFIKELRRVFQGENRYDSIKTLVTVLSPLINKASDAIPPHSMISAADVINDVFDQFSLEEQTSFVRDILDKERTIVKPKTLDGEVSLELRVLHEFYLRNHPIIDIQEELGIDKTIFQPGNNFIKLKKAEIINISKTKHIDLAKIDAFQKLYGIPMLIPLEEETFLLNEYELKYKKSRNIRYKIRSGKEFDVPDVLELYIDKTGSMFLERDKENRGFNDGSRYDNSVSVLYGFITTLYEQAKKQKKTCYVRIHSFSEIQVNSPLIKLQEFIEGDQTTLKVLFKPENGYDYENLNLEIFNDGLKRVYVIITDGDLVIEGRTERESKKLQQITMNRLNKVILFEMERKFSLGLAVEHQPLILTYSVKSKEMMFQQGIDVILPM
ncbi:MAG: hypothetical protein ACXACX_05980 [Candidatus Hodarchaeales archaeon]